MTTRFYSFLEPLDLKNIYRVKYCFTLYLSIQISPTALHIRHAFSRGSWYSHRFHNYVLCCTTKERLTRKSIFETEIRLLFSSLFLLSISLSLSTSTKGFHYRAHRGISWRWCKRLVLRLINLGRLIDRSVSQFPAGPRPTSASICQNQDDVSRNRQTNRSFANGFMISVIRAKMRFARFAVRAHTSTVLSLAHLRLFNALNMSENLFPEWNVNTYRR